MTFAPPTLNALRDYWKAQGGDFLGIVGDTGHVDKGVSYHLGKSQLTANAYSRRTARDKAGLTEAASAIDLGRLDGSLDDLRAFSAWFAAQCKAGKPGYEDVREVIWWDEAGGVVLGWSDLSPNAYIRNYGDLTHKTHTHISYYRDSEKRDKTAMFRPYFEEADMGIALNLAVTRDTNPYDSLGTAKLKVAGVRRVKDDVAVALAVGTDLGVVQVGVRVSDNVPVVALNHAGELHITPRVNVTFVPLTAPPATDCTAQVKAATDPLNAQITQLQSSLTACRLANDTAAQAEQERIALAEADRIRGI